MSVIQRDKNRPGVRFIILEELSNIDDTNFGLFPEIAKMFGYQLMTMTPKPFGSYSESEWYLHMLIRGKDKNINYTPMSFFRTKLSKQKLEEYMAGGKIEAKETLTISPSTDEDVVVVAKTETVAPVVVEETITEVPKVEEITATNETFASDTIGDAETIIEAELASETSTEIMSEQSLSAEDSAESSSESRSGDSDGTEIKIEEVKDVPSLPELPNQLHDERKEEFLGLKEEGKVEEEKKDENQNIEGEDNEEIK
jgi:hypothetical protein